MAQSPKLRKQIHKAKTRDQRATLIAAKACVTKVSSRGKDSRRTTSVASSSSSAQLQEKARIAELMAEKLMVKRKQAIKAAEEELKLDTEIAKAQARERVFEEIDEVKSQNSPESRKDPDMIVQPPAKSHPVSTARHETIPLPTLSASSVTDSNCSIGRSHVLPQTITRRPDVNATAKPHKPIHKK
jgi:hypothetical protein